MLTQLHKTQAMAGQFGVAQASVLGDSQVYLWVGLSVGLGATLFAGPLARLLTFDAAPGEPPVDFDRLTRR